MAFSPENMMTGHLRNARFNYARKLQHKRRVQSQHAPGTPYHTRASREAMELERRISLINAELGKRGES